ncbi:MAG: MaoC family dehydratase N-terminal domain-containing protein [Kordiimonadaceae bacterium]|nr:MaoC family dehydratase N-terminal domain-containing protein [Kordiimonadaceae bacterium]
MLDKSFINYEMPPFETCLEKGQMEIFARALNEKNSIYTDEEVARAQGYRSIVAMPTYVIRLGTRDDLIYSMFDMLKIELSRLLHGEQEFKFGQVSCAGDVLTGKKKIVDIFEKKQGALSFLVTSIEYTNQYGAFVCSDQCTFVIRNS